MEEPEDHSPPPPSDSPGPRIPGMPPSLKPPRSWELIQSGLTGPVCSLRPQSLSLANSPWDTPVGTPGEAPTGFMSLTRPRQNDRKKPRPTSLPVTLGEALERALPPKQIEQVLLKHQEEKREAPEEKEAPAESSDWDSEEEFEDEDDVKDDDAATLGREGTMQGRDEIWQANETVMEKSSDDDLDDDEEEDDDEEDEEEDEVVEVEVKDEQQREEKSEDSDAELLDEGKEVLNKKREGRAILPEFPTPIKVPNVQFTAREISLDDPPAAPPRKKKHRKQAVEDSDADDGFTKAPYAPLKRRLRAVVQDR